MSEDFSNELRLADFDRLLAGACRWVDAAPEWPAFDRAKALWARISPRLENLRVDLDRVLVVGTVGGTGTGKSTLLNALIGQRVCNAGDVQRPTTIRPVVLAHPDVDLSFLKFEDGEPEIHRLAAPILKQVILVDCPDPDTQGRGGDAFSEPSPKGRGQGEGAGAIRRHPHPGPLPKGEGDLGNRNLDILRRVLPSCDVLLYVGTAQKYKTHAVAEEVLRHAPGRQVVFVQTHANVDSDITADWQKQLESQGFEVPRMFRLDGEEAIERAEHHLPPPPEFSRLVDFLHEELAGRARHRILRANALDLLEWFLRQTQQDIDAALPKVKQLEAAIPAQRAELFKSVRTHLQQQLRGNQGVWRARLLRDVTLRWGWGPFAGFIRLFGSAKSLLRFAPALRARGLAPMLVAGGWGVGKAVADKVRESLAEDRWLAAAELGINTGEVARATSVLTGLAAEAGIEMPSAAINSATMIDEDSLAMTARRLYQQVDSKVESAIERRVAKRAGAVFHFLLEMLFITLPAVLLYKLAKNFFYDHLWMEAVKPLLGLDFLIQSALWVLVWGLVLRGVLACQLQRGLKRDLSAIAEKLSPDDALGPLFGEFASAAAKVRNHATSMVPIRNDAQRLRDDVESSGSWQLGRLKPQADAGWHWQAQSASAK
jgi:hypothetical protein